MSFGDCLMAVAIFSFCASGLMKLIFEGQPGLGLALVLVGAANGILMTKSNTKPAPLHPPPYAEPHDQ